MRSKTALTALCLAVVIAATAMPQGDDAWFDMENCVMCKPLMETPGLMDHMTWSHYDISNGVLSVTTVDDEYAEPYAAACMVVAASEEQMMAGEDVVLCNMCQAMVGLMARGMTSELVETDNGHIRISTADDEELVADIHAWAARTRMEMAKMAAMEEE